MKRKGEADHAGATPGDPNKKPGRGVSEPQMALYGFEPVDAPADDRTLNGKANKVDPKDRAFHDWYRFILSYPPHLVRHYLQDFSLNAGCVVLDPFCGTGTTLVEAKRCGVPSIGLEANPFAQFASSVKTDWDVDPGALEQGARQVARRALEMLERQGIVDGRPFMGEPGGLELRRLPPDPAQLLLRDSISPLPLHKTLVLLDCMRDLEAEPFHRHAQLALANALVYSISNLHFGPEVGVGKPKPDAPVVPAWLAEIGKMAADLRSVSGQALVRSVAHLADARQAKTVLDPQSVDGVITSPPYPNEKDYTRTTRLESVILGFISSKSDLRALKKTLVRSNTRGVYKEDDDDAWVSRHPEIQRIAEAIERRRLELGKDSGFERLYGGSPSSILAVWRATWPTSAQCCAPAPDLPTS